MMQCDPLSFQKMEMETAVVAATAAMMTIMARESARRSSNRGSVLGLDEPIEPAC